MTNAPSQAAPRATHPAARRVAAAVLAFALAAGMALGPGAGAALANVRRADVVVGETVDARGLAAASCPNIEANYAIAMDEDGTVYFERDADTQTHIASITKIMTAIVALENAPLDQQVTVSKEAASVGESSADLKEGDVLSLRDAVTALLTSSGNDAAIALADAVGAQWDSTNPQRAFVDRMNAKASDLGMGNTLFANPHGLDFDRHAGEMHSTARDVATMSAYALRNDAIRETVAKDTATIAVTRADGTKVSLNLESTDELIGVYDGAAGIKTGFTALAGECFAGASNRDGRYLFAIVLDSTTEQQRFTDATTLFDWVYGNEVSYPAAHSPETVTGPKGGEVPLIARVAHADWTDVTVPVTLSDPEAAVEVFKLNGNISQSLDFDTVSGNVRAGDKVGTITLKQRNEPVATFDLVAAADVAAPNFFEGIGVWWSRLFASFGGGQTVAATETVNETPLLNDKTTS